MANSAKHDVIVVSAHKDGRERKFLATIEGEKLDDGSIRKGNVTWKVER